MPISPLPRFSLRSCQAPLLALLLVGRAPAATPQAADEILSALQTCLETGVEISPLVDRLDGLEAADLTRINTAMAKAWPQQLQSYHTAFAARAQEQHQGEARNEQRRLVRELRDDFHEVGKMGENEMKEPLKKISWPALQSLRELLIPSAAGVLRNAPPALRDQRRQLLTLASFRNGLFEASVSVEPPHGQREIAATEKESLQTLYGLDRNGMRIMEKNTALAERNELPPAERQGLRELNEMRLLVGLNALVIDPELCQAARDHSKDMAEHGFFSHTSPLPGKETPSARAAKAGTSGGGENIFMGSRSAAAANKGWFFSPGHHKNMFQPSYRRVGLGVHETHWTQMFGR